MSAKAALKRLLSPETIAVFGGNEAACVIEQCKSVGFEGEIWAVNPNRRELAGVPCFAAAGDLPTAPDASFIAAPPRVSIEIVRDLAALGANGAVCFAAGFAETGDKGAVLQQHLREAAGDMAIIGPNCHGFLNYLDGVALWPDQHGGGRIDRGVALVLQSGNMGINLSMQQRGLDLAYVISIGNKCSLDLHDYIEILLDDPRVSAIGLHIEGIDKVHAFSVAAIKALRAGIPIVAIKTGRTSRGAEINMSHTASLAGSDSLYSALFKRTGIARCDTLAQFLETLKFVSNVGILPEFTFGSMSCSGGEAALIADYASTLHLAMPELSDESASQLRAVLGPKVHLSNPLDYHTYAWGDYEKLLACFSAMLKNRFACTMLVLDYAPGEGSESEYWKTAERALINAAAITGQRAVIVSTLPETLPEEVRARLGDAGIAPMQGLEECLFAIRAAALIGRVSQDVNAVQPVLDQIPISGSACSLDEWESKKELAEIGLQIPAGNLCAAVETVETAESLGYPVALKAVSRELVHKTERRAVILDLRDRHAVAAATRELVPHHEHFLVEKMVAPVIAEFIVGVSRDPTFGLSLLLGAGGTLVELLDDTVSILLPARRQELRTAIETLRVASLVDSYRGSEAGDMEAIVDAVLAIADYALANHADLEELDVNPLIVTPQGAVAADAYIRKVTDS